MSTPQNLILNVKYSWERRDSVRTREIYADTYQGASTDADGTLNFSKDQEVAAVGGLGRSQNVVAVHFTLTPSNTWTRVHYDSDPAGWTAIQLSGYTIAVDDVVHGTLMTSGGGGADFFEFKMEPSVDHSSPTDTTWKIVRWKEVKN